MKLTSQVRKFVINQIYKKQNDLFNLLVNYMKSNIVFKLDITSRQWQKMIETKSSPYKQKIIDDFFNREKGKINLLLQLSKAEQMTKQNLYLRNKAEIKFSILAYVLGTLRHLFIDGRIYNIATNSYEETTYSEKFTNILIERNTQYQYQVLQNINETSNKQYTFKSLFDKFSELICGYIYRDLYSIIDMYMSEKSQFIHTARSIKYIIKYFVYFLNRYIQKFKITEEFCQEHFNCTYEDLDRILHFSKRMYPIKDTDKETLITDAIKELKSIINNLDTTDIYQYLAELDNDDKIGEYYGEIDYDPHNVLIRSGPIVVYRDFSINPPKDVVLIGKRGEHHITCIEREDPSIPEKCKNDGIQYIDESYFYEPYCCYIEKNRAQGYSENELVQILKADPRIERVYLSPGMKGGQLKRLARRLK